jgi:hypothetical protein
MNISKLINYLTHMCWNGQGAAVYRGCWIGFCVGLKKKCYGQWNCWIWWSEFIFLSCLSWVGLLLTVPGAPNRVWCVCENLLRISFRTFAKWTGMCKWVLQFLDWRSDVGFWMEICRAIAMYESVIGDGC